MIFMSFLVMIMNIITILIRFQLCYDYGFHFDYAMVLKRFVSFSIMF